MSKIRDYEVVYIVDPLLDDTQLQPIIDKYAQLIADNGGEVVVAEKWEKRRLAYEVKGRREGIYIVMNYKGEPSTSAELERVMRLSEDVLRHIIVRDETPPQPKSKEAKEPVVAEAPAPEPVVEDAAAPEAVEEPVVEEAGEEEPAVEEAPTEEAEAEEPAEEEAPAEEIQAEEATEEEAPAEETEPEEAVEEPAAEEDKADKSQE